tara:strand:- start:138928 stop:140898 length:1971 start_codon:yes stop_codon:yes gene_type:complete
MPRRQNRPPADQPSNGNLPTAEDIATLNSLLAAVRTAADKNNFMPKTFAWTGIFHALNTFVFPDANVLENYIRGFLDLLLDTLGLDQDTSPVIQLTILLTLLFPILYLYKQLWNVITSVMLKICPNGIMIPDRTPHRGYQLKNSLMSRLEVKEMIEQLETLKTKLDGHNSYMFYLSIATSLLVPIPTFFKFSHGMLSIQPTPLQLNMSPLGVYFGWKQASDSLVNQMVTTAANYQQALAISSSVYDIWCRWNLPKQFKSFMDQLKDFSASDDWAYEPSKLSHDTTLYRFKNNNAKTPINIDGNACDIQTSHYISTVFRVFIEHGLTVYSVGEASGIYFPYHSLSKRACSNIKKKLCMRLQSIVVMEASINNNLKRLDELRDENNSKTEWDYYTSVNSRGEYSVHYFISYRDFYLRSDFEHAAQKLSSTNIRCSGYMLTIDRLDCLNEIEKIASEYKQQVSNYLSRAASSAFESSRTSPSDDFIEVTRGSEKTKTTGTSIVSDTEIEQAEITQFAHQYLHNPTVIANPIPNASFPDRCAFPLDIAWLSRESTRAYSAIHPSLFLALKQHLSRTAIEARLSRGTVMGARKTQKSKAGGTGIITSNEAYLDIEGRRHLAANFKIKFTNNIRIYGRKFDERMVSGINRILYLFDGWDYGH